MKFLEIGGKAAAKSKKPEASGLSNHDLSLANFIIQVPTANKLTSLNLSHAVIVVCYEIFKSIHFKKEKKVKILNKLASKKSIQNMIIFLEKLLDPLYNSKQ